MRVIGFDLSLNGTGVASEFGTATLKQKPADGDFRLVKIRNAIANCIDEADPQLAVLEDLPKNAMGAGITGQVQGVAREYLQRQGIPYLLVAAATLKKFSTNDGRADKAAMRAAWLDYSGEDNPRDDEVDAAWLRTLGLYMAGEWLPKEREWWPEATVKLRPAFEKLGVS